MNIEKELAAHAKALASLNKRFTARFRAEFEKAVDKKSRNYKLIDDLAMDNIRLDAQMKELTQALNITDDI